MKNSLINFTLALSSALCLPAMAANDLVGCKYPTGIDIPPKLCNLLRDLHDQEVAIKEAQEQERRAGERQRLARQQQQEAARAEAQRLADDQAAVERAARLAAEAQAAAINEARYAAHQKADADRLAALRKHQQQEEREETRQAATYNARVAKLRRECGGDFQTPHIGMPLARAKQCVGDMRLVSQINTVDGVASSYRVGPLMLTAKGGNIVSWVNLYGR